MNRHLKIQLFLCILICCIIAVSGCGRNSSKMPPQAVKGVLDLSKWNFLKDGQINMSGEWEFYWDRLLTPQDFKNNLQPHMDGYAIVPEKWRYYMRNDLDIGDEGFATFRLKVKLDKAEDIYFIKSLFQISAYKIWIDDKCIFEVGNTANNKEKFEGKFFPNTKFFSVNGNEFDVIVQVSNFGFANGGFVTSLVLGNQKNSLGQAKKIIDIFAFTSILTMGIYHIILYLFRKNEKSILFFGITCFCISIRVLFMGEMLIYTILPIFPLLVYLKISVLTCSIAFLFFVAYIYELYKEDMSKRFVIIVTIVELVYSILTIITPNSVSNNLIMVYQIIVVPLCGYLIYTQIRIAIKKREGSLSILAAYSIVFLLIINEVLYSMGLIHSIYLLPYGMFLFIFVQSIMLAKKFAKSFHTVETLSIRLLSLSKLKDEFLANTSHELKTPLNGIIGIAQNLLDGVNGELEREKARNLSLIVSSGKRLSNIINDILDFSKLKNGDIQLNRTNVDMQKIVQVVFDVIKPLVGNKQLELINNITDAIPNVYGDENRIFQIMFNLIDNAVKFTENGKIEINAFVKGEMLLITVEDTGIGIAEDKLEDIFKSFEQADGSISREYGGIGLGLNISEYLVELHGGTINVRSKWRQGSIFEITLPYFKSQSKSLSNEKKPLDELIIPTVNYCNNTTNGYNNAINTYNNTLYNFETASDINDTYKILIVDDDQVNLQVLVNCFLLKHYSVTVAQTGEKALNEVEKSSKEFDLVILDVMMPRISGYEVCRILREKYNLSELPILLLTVKNLPDDILMGFEVGANDYLAKPFDEKELMARVNALLQLKKSVKQEELLLKSQMIAFNAQIKPHFLFNSLNTIIHYLRKEPEEAGKLLVHFSNYLRSCFTYKDIDELIPFQNEINNIKAYLSLEKARFGNRLNVIYDIDEEIEINIPPLILQPIVENAVRHGLLSKSQGGTVIICAKIEDTLLKITVEDDGIGIEKDKLLQLFDEKDKNHGIGVTNVNLRMKSIYGSNLEIQSEPDKGTVVIYRIPIR